ncbi:Vms1/Ankzf1 family peptidyl-tRNA hydrolase [Streptomyces sp. 549]|uniref:baeRF2 domain-containing protein n=1 Tax=Streptomyces sp. 549 TaxID=3049076 RepID=UPI0024C2BAE1|nr:Vms1/Ankzf1 family peptidyl-tRNA hydrolase [Streptomyces sp. 549]MDK1472121.1 Vms1/Ankzf1 family peptidyl-tRNA hydrolase [Streptomyces sp. 549]
MDLGFLSPLYDRPGPWATVYFATDFPAEDGAARQELHARAAADRLAEQGADDQTCRAVHDALTALPRTPNPPGRALFATSGEVVLETSLAVAPDGDGPHATWAPLPHTAPLLDLADAGPRCLIARIDRLGADFEVRDTEGTREVGRLGGDDWPIRRTPTTDWSERHFQNSVENTWERNAAAVAEGITETAEREHADMIVLSGEHRQCITVKERLPHELRAVAVEAEHGTRSPGSNEEAGERKLVGEVADARAWRVRQRAAGVMDRFRAGRVPTDDGRIDAAEGVPALVEAAREHRIATLLLRPDGPDAHREVWVGEDPTQIAMRRTEARELGAGEPMSARADDALIRAAAATGAGALSVSALTDEPEQPSGLPVGGLGALLRWPYGAGAHEQQEALQS